MGVRWSFDMPIRNFQRLLTLKSIYPFLSMSKVRKTWSQNSSALPEGKNILYMSTNLAGVNRPLGQSCWNGNIIVNGAYRDNGGLYLNANAWSSFSLETMNEIYSNKQRLCRGTHFRFRCHNGNNTVAELMNTSCIKDLVLLFIYF